MPAPKPARLRHVPVRLRVTVDPKHWAEAHGTAPDKLDDAVRRHVVALVAESPDVVSVRRDQR